jgi:alpha-glucosidase
VTHGLGPRSPHQPDPVLALKTGRAATALMLALPGSAYLFQGEELGLPEVVDIPDEFRQDPTFRRTHGDRYGRDGCRVPIPWEADAPSYGFSPSGKSWLPQPEVFGELARDRQRGVASSTLELYRRLLSLRREHQLGSGELTWIETDNPNVLAFSNHGVSVWTNFGNEAVSLPAGNVIVSSVYPTPEKLEPNHTVWVTTGG